MSQFKLFRPEALKNQYRASDFGESIIEQPKGLGQALGLLSLLLLCTALAVWFWPIQQQQQVMMRLLHSHFLPLVSAMPVVVEQQLVPSGSFVQIGQPVASVRQFSPQQPTGVVTLLQAVSAGEYFAEAEVGATLPALQPIGRILRGESERIYQFALSSSAGELLIGQQIAISSGQHRWRGRVISLTNHPAVVGVQLDAPVDRAALNPGSEYTLLLRQRFSNVFALLRQHNAAD